MVVVVVVIIITFLTADTAGGGFGCGCTIEKSQQHCMQEFTWEHMLIVCLMVLVEVMLFLIILYSGLTCTDSY